MSTPQELARRLAGMTPDQIEALNKRLTESRPSAPRPFCRFKRMTHSWELKFWRVTFIWCNLKHTYKWMLFWG